MSSPTLVAALCLGIALACTPDRARASGEPGSRLRIDLSYLSVSSSAEDAFDFADVSDRRLGAGFTVQFSSGFYARTRLAQVDVVESDFGFGGQSADVLGLDEGYTTGALGVGYRLGGGGAFWGLGLRVSAAEDAAASGTALLFREKDTADRHGVVALGYTTGADELETYSLTGRHVWFGKGGGIGFGLIWSAIQGNAFFGEVELSAGSFGLVLMFRERP